MSLTPKNAPQYEMGAFLPVQKRSFVAHWVACVAAKNRAPAHSPRGNRIAVAALARNPSGAKLLGEVLATDEGVAFLKTACQNPLVADALRV